VIWVSQLLLNDGELNRIGSNSGAMAQVGPISLAQDIPAGDLETA